MIFRDQIFTIGGKRCQIWNFWSRGDVISSVEIADKVTGRIVERSPEWFEINKNIIKFEV